jgi:hypothetical protein
MALIQNPQDDQKVRDIVAMAQGDFASTMSPAGEIERYGDALLRIAREGGKNLFSLPYNGPGADSKDLKTVLDSFGGKAKFSVLESTDGQKFISLTDDLKVGDPVLVPGHFLVEGADDSTVTTAKIASIQDGRASVVEEDQRTNTSSEKSYPVTNIVKQKTFIRVDPQPPGRWVIDSSQGGNGKILMSDSIYQGIYKWAKNNGTKIVPDTSTSFAGNMRRNAHQLSSALREQSAEHFIPTDDQLLQMFPDKPTDKRLLWWGTRNTAQKIEALARAEVNYVEQILPDLVQLTYDPTTDSIMEAGERLDKDRGRQRVREILERAKGEGPSDTDRIGERTAYRYLAAKSWLSASQGQPWSSGSIGSSGTLDGAFMSPAGDAMKMIAKLTGAETKTTFNGGTYVAGGALSPDGKLDKRAGDKWRDSRHLIAASTRRIDLLSSRLVKAVKGTDVSTQTMNTALGNLDNPLTQAQRSEVRRMREIDENEANAMEGAFIAKNREAYKVKQREAIAQLPADVAEVIGEMNEHIAEHSRLLKDAGFLDPHIAATVDANLGVYLHRSYQIFDDEKWAQQVRQNTKVMQAAEALITRNIEQRNAAELTRQIESEGGFISKADAQAQSKGTAKREEIDKALDDLLSIGEEGMGGVILRGRIPGQKDLSILDQRGNIAPEIQALWGRYEDPTINYAKSVMKMSTLAANHQFLSDLRGMGLKEGWLYEGAETDRPRGYLKISSDNNKSLAPLAGLHGDKLLVEALYQMFPQNGVSDNYAWVRALSKVTGWSMAAKTVLSPVAQVRNNFGNILFDVAGGNFGFSDIPKLKERMEKAFNMSFRAAFNAYPKEAEFRKAMVNEMQELVRRGVIGESLVGNLLGQLMEAKRFSKSADQFSNHLIGKLKPAQNALSGVWDVAQRTYASSDDFWKVMGY